ncbi:MAG: cytotoxic translational repressor of toxin-antitoxin stability system [Devosiaceae bacterium]|nr:cytotoxic translational repressor of toxin-antitoxin stability system [Devosiaceae bacterium]
MQKSRAQAIIEKIEAYARGGPVDAIKMSRSGFIRIRVGQWRVIIDDERVVLVIRIKPRGDVYK